MPRFKVTVGHDSAVVECSSQAVAERSVRAHFGIRGSDHQATVEETTDPIGHTGQQTLGDKKLEVKILEDTGYKPPKEIVRPAATPAPVTGAASATVERATPPAAVGPSS
jgi:hypothetical protein